MKAISFIFLIMLSSCQVSSRIALSGAGGRNSYNETLQKTNNEQMLLNLVRLRYIEFPYFLDVNNITTQFTYASKVVPLIPVPGFNNTNPGTFEGEFSWQNQPTISYTPLEGQTFANQLFYPIDLTTLQQLIYAGWDIDRVFRICVQSVNAMLNVPTASGPYPDNQPNFDKFLEMSKLMRQLQLRGVLHVGVKVQKGEDNEIRGSAIQITFPINLPNAEELKNLLGANQQEKNHYIVDIPLGFNNEIEVGIMPRSLMASMYYLSLGVEVPEKHIESHQVWVPKKNPTDCDIDWNDISEGLFVIRHSKKPPQHAYVSVKYKGYWFYIDDRDLESKRTFVLLLQIYNLQSTSIKQSSPLLSLPLG